MEQKQRHGCLTAYLVVGTLLTLIGALFVFAIPAFLGSIEDSLSGADLEQFQNDTADLPGGAGFAMVGAATLLGLVGYVGLWMWKKWGFWLILATAILNIVLVVALFPASQLPGTLVQTLIGVGVLYGVLQIGQHNKGWPQLD